MQSITGWSTERITSVAAADMTHPLLASPDLSQTDMSNLPAPSMALLFHTSDARDLALVTAHEVIRDRSGQSHIGPGRVALPADEARLAALLSTRNRRGRIMLTPPSVIYHDESALAWWMPPACRPMFLRTQDGNQHEPVVRWPSLVGVVVGRKLHIVAIDSQERPTLHDPVFHAPLGNVYSDTSVCTGSARLPTTAAVTEVDGWISVVTNTYFTHDNHSGVLAKPKGKKKKSSRTSNYMATDYWAQRDGINDPMPSTDLVPLDLTLGEWLEAIIDGDEA